MFIPTIEQVSSDARGEIYVIHLPEDRELVLIHSKEGSLRGGHAHDVDEVVVLLSGAMRYHRKTISGPTLTDRLHPGDASFNPAQLFHMAEFLEDSWLMESKLTTPKGAWRNIDYNPWRAQVAVNAAG